MGLLADTLKSWFEEQIGEGNPFPEIGAVRPSFLIPAPDVSVVLNVAVQSSDYAEVGAQTPVPCTSHVVFLITAIISSSNDPWERQQFVETLIRRLFKHLRENRTFGQSWIRQTRSQPHFLFGIVQDDSGPQAFSQMDAWVDYEDSLPA